MHITLESDYAIRIMIFMAQQNHRVDAKTISESTEVTLRFSLKILRKLAANGIVRSFKGTQGGYELARPASEITLREIVETVEGTYYLSRCLNPECGCNRQEPSSVPCKTQKVFCEISGMVQEKLAAVSLQQLI